MPVHKQLSWLGAGHRWQGDKQALPTATYSSSCGRTRPSTHIPVMLVARKRWITRQPESHSTGEQGLQIKARGWEGLALPTMCVGVLFPTEKGIQPLVPILRNPNYTAVTPGMLQEQPGKLARLTHYSRVVPCSPTTPQNSSKQMQALFFTIKKINPFFCANHIIKINNDLVLLSIFTSNMSSFRLRKTFRIPNSATNSEHVGQCMTAGNEELHYSAKKKNPFSLKSQS